MDAQRQRSQLEELLRTPVPEGPPGDPDAHATLRGSLATLRAFERKLQRLLAESVAHCQRNLGLIEELDREHPDYRTRYGEHYRKSLSEVGMRPESVPFIRYLDVAE